MRKRTALTLARVVLPTLLVLASRPAFAQIDLSGQWAARNHEDIGAAAHPGDYMGLPLNDEARARADAWSISYQAMPERQCIMYTSHYLVLGPQGVQLTSDVDPISGRVIAWRMTGAIDRAPRTIWMDGRPHPPEVARHTTAGFSTGVWKGDTLFVNTTHLVSGLLLHAGVPTSDQATINEYIVRHGSMLTVTMVLYDPIYLEEPYMRSKMWVLDPAIRMLPEPCEPVVEIPRPAGFVPHYLPGTNPAITEVSDTNHIPLEAVRGGAATMYPEYRKKLKEK